MHGGATLTPSEAAMLIASLRTRLLGIRGGSLRDENETVCSGRGKKRRQLLRRREWYLGAGHVLKASEARALNKLDAVRDLGNRRRLRNGQRRTLIEVARGVIRASAVT